MSFTLTQKIRLLSWKISGRASTSLINMVPSSVSFLSTSTQLSLIRCTSLPQFFRKLNAKALPLLIKYPKQIASTESVSNLYSPCGASSYPPPPHNAQSTPTSTPPTVTLSRPTDLRRLDPIPGSDSGSVSSPGSTIKETSMSQIGAPSGA